MGKWFFPSCLPAFAAKLTDKENAHVLDFYWTCYEKSHVLFTSHSQCFPPTADNKKDWRGVGGWKQLEGKSNLP